VKDLKATVKGYKNRLAHLTRSREQWRIRAERLSGIFSCNSRYLKGIAFLDVFGFKFLSIR